MQTSHGFEERISGMDDAMEPTLEILTTSLPATRHTVICKLYSTLYSVYIHYKNLQHHLRRAAKLPSNATGKCSLILQHTGFVIMNYSLKCAMHKDLSQQTNCSLSNQSQYNSGARSGMLTSYNIHTTGIQSIESPTYYIIVIITILILS